MQEQSTTAKKIVEYYLPHPISSHIINKESMKLGYMFMAQINSEWANL